VASGAGRIKKNNGSNAERPPHKGGDIATSAAMTREGKNFAEVRPGTRRGIGGF